MSKTVSKFALAASVALALAFTFSCSSDDGDNGSWSWDGTFSSSVILSSSSYSSSGSSSSVGQSSSSSSSVAPSSSSVVPSSSSSVDKGNGSAKNITVDFIYNRNTMTCNDGVCTGEKWNGNGTVRMEAPCDIVGEIVNGTLSLNLPSASEIPESCFYNATEAFNGASVSPPDVKITGGDYDFNVDGGIDDEGNPYNILKWETPKGWENTTERVRGRYWYFSKDVIITGSDYNINASEGWNEIYSNDDGYTTDLNAIGGTKPIWYIYYNPSSED